MNKQILDQENKNPAIIHVEPREAVKELLTKLKDVYAELALIDSQIPQDVKDNIQSLEDKAKAIKEEIKELVSFEVQESIKTNDGQAIYKKGSKRIIYDSKLLDAIQDKTIREAIEPARKETQVKGSVQIEVY